MRGSIRGRFSRVAVLVALLVGALGAVEPAMAGGGTAVSGTLKNHATDTTLCTFTIKVRSPQFPNNSYTVEYALTNDKYGQFTDAPYIPRIRCPLEYRPNLQLLGVVRCAEKRFLFLFLFQPEVLQTAPLVPGVQFVRLHRLLRRRQSLPVGGPLALANGEGEQRRDYPALHGESLVNGSRYGWCHPRTSNRSSVGTGSSRCPSECHL